MRISGTARSSVRRRRSRSDRSTTYQLWLVLAALLIGAAVGAFVTFWLRRGAGIDLDRRTNVLPSSAVAPLAGSSPISPDLTSSGLSSAMAAAESGQADDSIPGDGGPHCPDAFPVKGNTRSGIYHVPGNQMYERTIPNLCFRTAEAAERAGFRAAIR